MSRPKEISNTILTYLLIIAGCVIFLWWVVGDSPGGSGRDDGPVYQHDGFGGTYIEY